MGLGQKNWAEIFEKVNAAGFGKGSILRKQLVTAVNEAVNKNLHYLEAIELLRKLAAEVNKLDPESKVLLEYKEWKERDK